MVSLVMPVWKPRPQWLREAVASALAERGCEVELVVVDDGNPEPVSALLADFEDPRLSLVRIPHGGVCRARNAGIERARGEAIRFLDADDVAEDGSTARLFGISGEDRAIAYGDTLVCDPDLRPQRMEVERQQGDVLLDCVLGGFSVYITAILFPREVIDAAGGFDPDFDINEDFEYLLRALEYGRVRGGGFVATRYRRHEDSATAGEHAGRMMDMKGLDKFFGRHPELRGTSVERRARAHLLVVAAEQLVSVGRYGDAIRRLGAAFRRAPGAGGREAAVALAGIPRAAARRALAGGP